MKTYSLFSLHGQLNKIRNSIFRFVQEQLNISRSTKRLWPMEKVSQTCTLYVYFFKKQGNDTFSNNLDFSGIQYKRDIGGLGGRRVTHYHNLWSVYLIDLTKNLQTEYSCKTETRSIPPAHVVFDFTTPLTLPTQQHFMSGFIIHFFPFECFLFPHGSL